MDGHNDTLFKYELLGGMARAMLADTKALTQTARDVHGLSQVGTAAMGRLLTATAMMASDLKSAGDSLTARVEGGGPLGLLLAVGKPDGTVKGYVESPAAELPSANGKLPVGAAVGNAGMLTVIKDLGLKEPYVGRVKLKSGELGEDFALYFTVSEQTPSLVSLGVLVGETVVSAGGVIVQMMPGASEEAVREVEARAGRFVSISATLRDLGTAGAAQTLFEGLEPRLLDQRALRYQCDCTRERASSATKSGASRARNLPNCLKRPENKTRRQK